MNAIHLLRYRSTIQTQRSLSQKLALHYSELQSFITSGYLSIVLKNNQNTLFQEVQFDWSLEWASLVAQNVKNLSAMQETRVGSLGWEASLEKGRATHSSILAWRIPWTERSLAGLSPWDRKSQTRVLSMLFLRNTSF